MPQLGAFAACSTRRAFLQAAGAASLLASHQSARVLADEQRRTPTEFQIACMTLPYAQFPFERALTGIRAAGYNYVAWGHTHQESGGQKVPVLPPDAPPERLWSEVYNSDALNREHQAIQALPRNPEDAPTVEYVAGPILLYSDSTHATNFGNASLWPAYLFFLNLTKYIRERPSAYAAHHLAYIPTVSFSPRPRGFPV